MSIERSDHDRNNLIMREFEMTGFDCVWQHWIVLASCLLCNLCISCQWRAACPRAPFQCREINIIDNRKWRDANLRKITSWLLCWAVIFDGPNLTASLAAIFALVQVVFLDCPFLDCLNHGVTTSTVGVTTFTNHSVRPSSFWTLKFNQHDFPSIWRMEMVFNL